jgi:hypothetical protein
MAKTADFGLEILLALNGDRYFVDEHGEFAVIFSVSRVAISQERPTGIKYSLVLLNANNERVVCFNNAHAVSKGSGPGKRRLIPFDHKHVGNRVLPYEFKDALALLQDFWEEVVKNV